jgi:hypothetical protein
MSYDLSLPTVLSNVPVECLPLHVLHSSHFVQRDRKRSLL